MHTPRTSTQNPFHSFCRGTAKMQAGPLSPTCFRPSHPLNRHCPTLVYCTIPLPGSLLVIILNHLRPPAQAHSLPMKAFRTRCCPHSSSPSATWDQRKGLLGNPQQCMLCLLQIEIFQDEAHPAYASGSFSTPRVICIFGLETASDNQTTISKRCHRNNCAA